MLISDLNLTEKKALAKRLKALIEPDKAKTTSITKEAKLRQYLLKVEHITITGIQEIIDLLSNHYSCITVERLKTKIQKSVVWDACLCKLSHSKLEEMFYKKFDNIIITTSVFDELFKLAFSENNLNARELLYNIMSDSSSELCTLVDIPRESSYTDNQLLDFCCFNHYALYTYDYVLGLRAKCRKIDVTIFNDIDMSLIKEYVPNPSGKNIVLSDDIIGNVSLNCIITAASELKANKFILTSSFLNALDGKCEVRDIVRFFVADNGNNYSLYISDDMSILDISEKYNAIIFSSSLKDCIFYKTNFIDYKLLDSQHLKLQTLNLTTLSTTNNTNDINNSNDVCDEEDVDNTNSANNVDSADTKDTLTDETSVHLDSDIESSTDEITADVKSASKKHKKTYCNIPYYKPSKKRVSLSRIPPNELIWVLDEHDNEVMSSNKGYPASIGFTIIHGVNLLNDSYTITTYKIVNNRTSNYGDCTISYTFSKELVQNLPDSLRKYAEKLLLMT